MLKRLIIFISIFSLAALPFFFRNNVEAASLTSISDTISRAGTAVSANHTIAFTLASTWDATETVVVDFADADGFDTAGFASNAPLDYDITWAGADKTIVANGACAADSIEINTVNTTTDTFTFTLCAGSTASGGTDAVVIEIGNHAAFGGGGTNQIENATGPGSKVVSITGPGGDSGQFALAILADDQVTVSATVDPTITSSLDTTTCALGTLDAATVNGCEITNTVTTNAASGYSSTITENGELCSPSVAVCTYDIAEVVDTDIVAGTEEYGVSTTDLDATGITADYDGVACGGATENATAIEAAKIYADETTPQSSDATTLCHAASITATTEAGSYSHIVTHITTGNF